MQAVVDGFKWVIEFLKQVWNFIGTLLEGIGTAFRILTRIITLTINTIITLPSWIQAFMMITITITIIYFIVGRETGKSD